MNRKTPRFAISALAATTLAGCLASIGATPGIADPTTTTTATAKATAMAATQQMSGPSLTSHQVGTTPAGTQVDLVCYVHGQKVLGQDAPKYNIYGATPTAAVADRFKNYVIDQGYATIAEISWSDPTAAGAQPGDVIAYDWDNGSDGVIDHLAIVVATADDGRPVVAQHSPSELRPWNTDEKGEALFQKYKESRAYVLHEIA